MNMQLPTGASRFVFILAHPAGHVGAPRHYSPYFWENGLDWPMVPLDVAPAHLAETIGTLARSDSVVGFNLTMPHKPAAFALGDAVGRAAEFEGAVTTIRIEAGGKLVGEPFDGGGFLNAARAEGVFDSERPCVVIGAGGAGRAICHALAGAGLKRLGILTKRPSRLRRSRQNFVAVSRSWRSASMKSSRMPDLLVNTTSLGLHASDALPMDPAKLSNDCGIRYYRGAPDRINECGRRACP